MTSILHILPDIQFKIEFYSNLRPCIIVLDHGKVYGKLSVNIPEATVNLNEFFAKTYGENKNWATKILRYYRKYFIPTRNRSKVGYSYVTKYQITNQFIEDQFEATYDKSSDIYFADPPLFNLYEEFVKTQK